MREYTHNLPPVSPEIKMAAVTAEAFDRLYNAMFPGNNMTRQDRENFAFDNPRKRLADLERIAAKSGTTTGVEAGRLFDDPSPRHMPQEGANSELA